MPGPVKGFYRVWFTNVDPILTAIGIYTNIFAPETILRGITPHYSLPPARETTALLTQTAGFFVMILIQELYLLFAKPSDVRIWQVIEGSTAMVDMAILVGVANILSLERRTSLSAWRSEEWINIVITAGVLLIRIAFLFGFGMGGRNGRKGKKGE